MLTDQQRRAVVDLKNARQALGPEGNKLIEDVLAKGWSIMQVSIDRKRTDERGRRYIGERFRECLKTLAIRFGYSNART
jgi:hypothetical protein